MGHPRVSDRLKLADVAAYIFNKTGVTIKSRTAYYWATKGKNNYSHNKCVKLRSERILDKIYTRESWVDEFIREVET